MIWHVEDEVLRGVLEDIERRLEVLERGYRLSRGVPTAVVEEGVVIRDVVNGDLYIGRGGAWVLV